MCLVFLPVSKFTSFIYQVSNTVPKNRMAKKNIKKKDQLNLFNWLSRF